ncbi:major facilitator super transporter protein [Coemansia sp. Benny D115]|nr:major facilitator super transporter protein [Coemansia sp. Benny D115]
MRLGRHLFLLSAAILVELVGLGFFIKGFFPYKKNIPGFASTHDQPAAVGQSDQQTHQYDRLVVMLVDALRNDFVFGNESAMAYTQGLLRDGRAIGFTARAMAPTVTMPRIKALMTGTVPNFLDAVLNIAEADTSSSLKFQDNLLWQLKNKGKRINMFGDDTWLRLFPDMFERTDGTSSFFVTDTVEVDNNVTRHVRPELERDDWDVTIFHYLGLDHIGHLAGPNSPRMKPKQKEMDQVVQTIFEIVQKQDEQRMSRDKLAKPTLVVLLGDHAMNEIGNHGGNSLLETSTVLVFMGQGIHGEPFIDRGKNALSALLAKETQQVSLVPTLALLFGVPIPKNNLGLPLAELLGGYSDDERLRLLQLAAHQIFGVAQASDSSIANVNMESVGSVLPRCEDSSDDHMGKYLRCKYMRALVSHTRYINALSADKQAVAAVTLADEATREYYDFMEQASAYLSRTFSGYDLGAMLTGTVIFAIATISLFALYQASNKMDIQTPGVWVSGIINFKTKEVLVSAPAVVMAVTYVISLFASSMIEEEHQFWYFWVQTALALRLVTSTCVGDALRVFGQMVLFRVVRAWNQTGQQWTAEADIRKYLNTSHTSLMWRMAALSCAMFAVCIYKVHSGFVCPGHVQATYKRLHAFSGTKWHRQHLKLSQRVFRGSLITALAVALAYQMERSDGCEALGISQSVWRVVRWVLPSDLSGMARLVYVLLSIAAASGILNAFCRARIAGHAGAIAVASLEGLVSLLPLLVLLSRPHNIPLLALFMAIFALSFSHTPRSDTGVSGNNALAEPDDSYCGGWRLPSLRPSEQLVHLCLIHASFFALGNSNSLASLDLSNAYTGVSRYNEVLVGVLMFVSNWAGPLWWAAAAFAKIMLSGEVVESVDSRMRRLTDRLVAAHVWQALTLLVLSIVVTVQRTHLFIWSVFSPRYLYQIAWFVAFYLLCATVGGVLWLGTLLNVY